MAATLSGPAPLRAAGLYVSPGWGPAPQPVVVEWMAVIEPALNSVVPAIQGLLQISGMLLRGLPIAIDLPGPEPAEAHPAEPSSMRSGLGHAGMFGPAEPRAEVLDVAEQSGTSEAGTAEADAGEAGEERA